MRRRFASMCVAVSVLLAAREAPAGPCLAIEAVDNYTDGICNFGDLYNSADDASNFIYSMTGNYWSVSNPAGYQLCTGQQWYDSDVFATDFADPEFTGNSSDNDTNYFDKRGTAISYFTGHGACPAGDTNQTCYPICAGGACTPGAVFCNSPPTGFQQPAFCRRLPGDSTGTCSYTDPGRAIQTRCGDYHNGYVWYGINGSQARWGESRFSGIWSSANNAGTNGGTNVVVLNISCAEMSNRRQEVIPAFAGIHLLLTVLTHTGDTANNAETGYWFPHGYPVAPLSSVADSYLDTTWSISDSSDPGSRCSNHGVDYGGAHGVNGCGGHKAMALGASASEATRHLSEDWYEVIPDDNSFSMGDGLGNQYYAEEFSCNFDCNTWTFDI